MFGHKFYMTRKLAWRRLCPMTKSTLICSFMTWFWVPTFGTDLINYWGLVKSSFC